MEEDADIHLVIADPTTGATMISEFPNPECPDAAGSAKRAKMARARNAFVRKCGMPSDRHFTHLQGKATITGVGFWDVKHATPQNGRAPTVIELHPVLSFTRATCSRLS